MNSKLLDGCCHRPCRHSTFGLRLGYQGLVGDFRHHHAAGVGRQLFAQFFAGSWQMTSPGTVTVQRSKNDIQIHCTKEGYQDAAAVIPSTFEGWTLGNVLIGGIIGFGVDAATGAMNDYPNAFQVPMTPLTTVNTAPLAPPPAPVVTPADKPKKPGV